MNPVSVDIKDLLVANSIGVFAATTGWSIQISTEPTDPDTVITIYDLYGASPTMVMDPTKHAIHYDNFQVRVRALNYNEGYQKQKDIWKLLKQRRWTVVAVDSADLDVRYMGVFAVGDIQWLKSDEQNRHIWVAGYQANRKEVV